MRVGRHLAEVPAFILPFYLPTAEAQLAQLDSGKVNLSVSLIGPRPSDGNVTGQAERFLEIDPVNFVQWLRVTIPFEDMNFYTVARLP